MGWGIEINGAYLSRMTKDGLPDKLEEHEEMIRWYKERLIALGSYTCPSVEDEDGNKTPIMNYSVQQVNEIFEELGNLFVERYLINLAIENPEDAKEC